MQLSIKWADLWCALTIPKISEKLRGAWLGLNCQLSLLESDQFYRFQKKNIKRCFFWAFLIWPHVLGCYRGAWFQDLMRASSFLTSWLTMCGRGEIGRHARFRFWCRKTWGFKSLRPHHPLKRQDRIFRSRLSRMWLIVRWSWTSNLLISVYTWPAYHCGHISIE